MPDQFRSSSQRAADSKKVVADLIEQAALISFPGGHGGRALVVRDGNSIRIRFPQPDIGLHYVTVTVRGEP